MYPEVLAHMARQSGLVLRAQARSAGLTDVQVNRLVRSGRWVAVRRGVYVDAETWDALDVWRGRPRLLSRAASLTMVRTHVVSHDSAAHELGMSILRPADPLVHVTYPGDKGIRHEYGVKHHLAPYHPSQLVPVDGRPVLGWARTGLDMAREHGYVAGVVAIDSALWHGASMADFSRALAMMRCWPQVTVARAALADADDGAESPLETLTRLLLREMGYEVETQFTLRDRGREASADMRVERHLIEADGLVKYLPVAEGGLASRPPHEVLWEEKRRQDFLCGFKLGMSRVTFSDHAPSAREATKRRLEREITDTERRFGTSIVDLAPYVVRRPRRRAA